MANYPVWGNLYIYNAEGTNNQIQEVRQARENSRNNVYYKLVLENLYKLKSILETSEQNLYNLLGVSNLNELNRKIQTCGPLLNFDAKYISNNLKIADLTSGGAGYFLQGLMAALGEGAKNNPDSKGQEKIKSFLQIINDKSDELAEYFQNNPEDPTIQNITTKGIQKLIDAINEIPQITVKDKGPHKFQGGTNSTASTSNRGLAKLLKHLIIQDGKLSVDKAISGASLSKHVKSELRGAFDFEQLKVTVQEKSNNDDSNTKECVIDYGAILRLNREKYAGFGYSGKLDMETLVQIRDEIYQQCLALAGISRGSEHEKCFAQAFDNFPIEGLVASNKANIAGILGEIQLEAVIRYITNNTRTQLSNIHQVGTLRSATTNAQTAVDLIIKNFGFQVKNYNEFASDIDNTVQISHQKNLTTWLSELNIDSTLAEYFKLFYGIKGYNIEYASSFEPIRQEIESMDNHFTNLWEANSDSILKLTYDYQNGELDRFGLDDQKIYNVFFYTSGKEFIPSSKIVKRAIKALGYYMDGSKKMIGGTVVTSSYSGKTAMTDYENYGWDEDESNYPKGENYCNIANKTKITIKTRLYLRGYYDALKHD